MKNFILLTIGGLLTLYIVWIFGGLHKEVLCDGKLYERSNPRNGFICASKQK